MTTTNRVKIPWPWTYCSGTGCGVRIMWIRTAAGKWMPCDRNHDGTWPSEQDTFDVGRHRPHWKTCPDSAKFREALEMDDVPDWPDVVREYPADVQTLLASVHDGLFLAMDIDHVKIRDGSGLTLARVHRNVYFACMKARFLVARKIGIQKRHGVSDKGMKELKRLQSTTTKNGGTQ